MAGDGLELGCAVASEGRARGGRGGAPPGVRWRGEDDGGRPRELSAPTAQLCAVGGAAAEEKRQEREKRKGEERREKGAGKWGSG